MEMLYAAIDVHKHVLQAAVLDPASGELRDARFPATREALREWAMPLQCAVAAVAIEATSGWRWVWRELSALGIRVELAEPAQTRALRGKKRHAMTDPLTDHLGVFSQLAGRVVMGVATVAGHERRRGWPTRSGPAGGAALRVA